MADSRPLAAEFVGTAFLLTAIVGSGIMAERLAAGNTAVALLANSIATGAALVALLLAFGPISGAHFNPAVTIAVAAGGLLSKTTAAAYVVTQVAGALAGVAIADLMFDEPVYAWATHVRAGWPQAFSEGVATFGLFTVIWACSRRRPDATPVAVAGYITGAYWFTSSTSFANPAVTLARALTNTFAGVRPIDVPAFIFAQAIGATAAVILLSWLTATEPRT